MLSIYKMTFQKKVGTGYEYYVLEHIKKDYEKVWHWKNFPEKLMYELNLIKDYDKFKKYRADIGADLVAFKNNKYYFIQCKNFKETIFIDTLGGFYFLLYENNLNGILYYNGSLSERLIDLSNEKIPFINLPFNNENIIFNEEIKEEIKPREYQIEAYNKLKNLNNSILSLPCSMGKTYISSLLAKDYDNIIILSPTRALAQQNLEKFKEYLKNTYNHILISIDGKTNIDEINKILTEKNIISSTFDSCNTVNLLINKLKNCYVIVDEFHNLSENNITDKTNEIYKLINYNANKVFLSATPIKNFMQIPSTNIYNYDWKNAIENKYICDFNIYLPNITEELTKFLEVIKNNYNQVELKLIKKAYNLIKGLLLNGDKKCICYLTTIDKANIFNKILTLIGNTFNIEIEREQIDCNTKRLKRNEIIEKFKNSNGLFILLNVHVLDEGIDIPECDSVYITQPNNNIINIVQRMCRANRIYKNKTECNIYLWCTENKTKNIFNYIFEKMDESIKNKINKILLKNTEKIIIEIKKNNKKNLPSAKNEEIKTTNNNNPPSVKINGKVNYSCLCGMNFENRKDNYNRHINKKNPCSVVAQKNAQEMLKDVELEQKNNSEDENNIYCPFCSNKFYKTINLDRHLEICKNKPEPVQNNKEQVNNKLIEINEKVNKILKEYEELKNKNAKLKKQIKKKKIPTTMINQKNILVNYNEMNLSKIDKELFIQPLLNDKIINKQKILKIIENIYINEKYPEYHNIIVTDKNRGYLKIYNNGEWKTYNFEPINTLIDGVLHQSKNIIFELKQDLVFKNIESIYMNSNHPQYHKLNVTEKKQGSLYNKLFTTDNKQESIKIYDNGDWKINNEELINMVINEVVQQSKHYTIELKQQYNKGVINTLTTSEKYINYCDSEFLEELKEQQIDDGIDNVNIIKRCVEFRDMVYKDTINLLHDKKNTLLKTQKNNDKVISLN